MSPPSPRATYRVQLRPGFGFDEAAALAPYLAELGISHLYASPILQAVPGSEHGYDVADPTRISEQLGGAEGFRRLVESLRAAGLGLLVDIVPNHMSTDARANPWWADVLEAGRESPHAEVFDIDWDPPQPELRGRVLLPVLGDTPEAVAGRGELRLERSADGLRLAYFDSRIPLSPGSLVDLLETAASAPGAGVLGDCAGVAAAGLGGGEIGLAARRRWWEELAAAVAAPPVAAALDRELERTSADPGKLLALCDRQHWLIAHWMDAATRLNHRRFFTITSLAGVRVEEPRVFDAVHGLIAGLVREGSVDGLRVDHVDGLRDPAGYLERLQEATGAGWVVVEKILERDEQLPAGWRTDGTTGYEFAALLDALSVDPAGRVPIDDLHAGFTGHTESFAHCVHRARLEVLGGELRSDVNRLAARLARVAADAGLASAPGLAELEEVLTAVIAELGVYRTYVDPVTGRCTPEDAALVGIAVARARTCLPGLRGDLLDLLADCLCGRFAGEGLELAARVQQLSPAVMAKGMEDTAFYRWNRLLALNEVGGDPDRFGVEVGAFHAACAGWVRRGDRGLLRHLHPRHQAQRGRARPALRALGDPRPLGRRGAPLVGRQRRLPPGRGPDPDTEYAALPDPARGPPHRRRAGSPRTWRRRPARRRCGPPGPARTPPTMTRCATSPSRCWRTRG